VVEQLRRVLSLFPSLELPLEQTQQPVGCVSCIRERCCRQMPPLTWITGDHRSKKNITQIRRHAGQNSGNKAEGSNRLQTTSSPQSEQQASSTLRSIQPSTRAEERIEGRNVDSPGSEPLDFRVHQSSDETGLGASCGATPAREQLQEDAHLHVMATAETESSSRAGSASTASGTSGIESLASLPTGRLNVFQLERSARQGLARTPDAVSAKARATTPSRKVAIWDLVNHSAEEEEQHRLQVLALTPRQDAEEQRTDYFGGKALRTSTSKQALAGHRSSSPRHQKPATSSASPVLQANISKRRKQASASNTHLSHSWRIGTPPHPMHLSKEDSQLEQTLLQTSTYYTENFASSWSVRLHERGARDIDSDTVIELFSASIVTAAGLLVSDSFEAADAIFGRLVGDIPTLLQAQHPQLYFFLVEISLDNDRATALGLLRSEVKRAAATSALKMLGASHPLS
jgi:hypothetical protein